MRHILDGSMGVILAAGLCGAGCRASAHEPAGTNAPPGANAPPGTNVPPGTNASPGTNIPPTEEPATPPAAAPMGERIVVGSDPCKSDADCVPVCACHAAACIAKATAPTCDRGLMCTQECRPGTMDCGGGCLCQGGRCAARLINVPPP
ncbi:hypothetical protein [Sorangium sp. So ce124]|uniref:hypothetical protein n=1 Tax=Sorangium sp. So ce124 TaxID=3133280 RepID=UPI003F601083